MNHKPAVVGLAFGDPLDERTFSGLSCQLFGAIRDQGCLAGTLSTAIYSPLDLLRGRIHLRRGRLLPRPDLNRRWLWRRSTTDLLSRRAARALQRFHSADAALQVGTHVAVGGSNLRHFCITDMTVTCAARAGMFHLGDFDAQDLAEAVLTQQRILDNCELVFVLSEWIRASVIEDCHQAPEKVIAVGAGANIDPIESGPDKYTSRNILFVAREWESKGGPLLLEALQLVRRTLPDVTLTIVGPQPQIADAGVTITGPLSKKKPAEYERLKQAYRNAACFCLLSEFDAFPNVVLEAQYAGTPVVALDRQSRREAVLDGVTGILVRDARAADVAQALLRILAEPATAQQMGARGRELVEARFTWPAVARSILAHIAARCEIPRC